MDCKKYNQSFLGGANPLNKKAKDKFKTVSVPKLEKHILAFGKYRQKIEISIFAKIDQISIRLGKFANGIHCIMIFLIVLFKVKKKI